MDQPKNPAIEERPAPLLFRYLSLSDPTQIERARVLLVENQLYFAKPSQLNDPFDCQLTFSFRMAPSEVRRYWRAYADKRDLRRARAQVEKMVQLSMTPEGREEMAKNYVKAVDSNTGIACFSETPVSTQMWSYYASGHTGIVVRFDFTKGPLRVRLLPFALPVRYCSAYPTVNYYQNKATRVTTILSSKANGWSHEREWRVILNEQSGLIEISPEMVDGVTFGMRTPPMSEAMVRGWLSGRKVDFSRIRPVPNSFDLQVVPAPRLPVEHSAPDRPIRRR